MSGFVRCWRFWNSSAPHAISVGGYRLENIIEVDIHAAGPLPRSIDTRQRLARSPWRGCKTSKIGRAKSKMGRAGAHFGSPIAQKSFILLSTFLCLHKCQYHLPLLLSSVSVQWFDWSKGDFVDGQKVILRMAKMVIFTNEKKI